MELNALEGIEVRESEEEEASSGSESSDDDDGMVEEDETYVKFVRSVFFDDYSGCSNTDEDDEEDYEPDNHDDEDSDNDEEEDKDLIRVQNRELRELVDGCWQTIVGEAPAVAAVPFKEEAAEEGQISSPLRVRHQTAEQLEAESPSTPPHNTSSGLFDNIDEELDLSLLSPTPALPRMRPSSLPVSGPTVHADSGAKPKTGAVGGPSVISNMVTKLFSESETSEAHVEGMPVHACRKLVARQMSMATQLLVQLLLQADERSDCFTKAFASLMELSNLREAALKKATLVQMNYQNATTIRNHVQDQRQQKLRESNASSAGSTNDCGDDSSDSENEYGVRRFRPAGVMTSSSSRVHRNFPGVSNDVLDAFVTGGSGADVSSGRRLTRSAMQNEKAVHSVFNVPILAKVASLFDMIDVSRRHIKQRVGHIPSASDKAGAGGDGSAMVRAHTLHAIREQVYTILPRMSMPAWRCLLPSAHYPLPRDIVRKLDPSTLTGRCLFTPTEDDLLLRGVMNVVSADSMWERVRNFYVPSKEAQLLEFRFTQMTSVSAIEDNNFKGYQKLSSDYRERDHEWTHAEQLELLRGFQVFGERWPLVRIFHLPHRRSQQLRAKWYRLQKDWQKVFQTQMYKSGAQREMTPEMRSFLVGLNAQAIEATAARLTAREQAAASRADTPSGSAGAMVKSGSNSVVQGARPRDKPVVHPASRNTLPSIPAGPALPAPLQGWPLALSHSAAMSMPAAAPLAAPMSGFPVMPFMTPAWLQPGGKPPSTQAEFIAQQQQFQQYQQFMIQQHHLFMMHQMQSQMQSQIHLPQQLPPQVQTPFAPTIPGVGPFLSGAPMQQMMPAPQEVPRAMMPPTTGRERSYFGDSIVDGPPLLREPTPEKSKRVRKYHVAGSMPSPAPADSTATRGSSSTVAQMSASSTEQDPSHGLGYLHDQDSMFSLLMSGNSIGYLDPTASVPMLDTESADSNSRSQEASLLTLVRAAAASTASMAEKTAKVGAPPSNPATQMTAQAPGAPALKSILSKPKKKTIKPTLISSSVGGSAALFESKRASPAFGLTSSGGSSATLSAQSSHPQSSSSAAADSSRQKPSGSSAGRGAEKSSGNGADLLMEDRSMMGFEGLSNMCFPDADQRLGIDEGASLHSPFLQGQSLLDASSFAFSNISRPREDIEASGKKSGGKRAAKESTEGTKKSKKVKKSADAVNGATSSATAVQDSVQFAFDETSNMSILGDFYNDADMGGVSNIGFSNITNLLSLAGSPMKSSASRGAKAGSRSGHSRAGSSRSGPTKRIAPAAVEAPVSSQRSFHHIAAVNASQTTAIPVTAARGDASARAQGNQGISESAAEATMKSPKKPRSGGIFAEVMANARKSK